MGVEKVEITVLSKESNEKINYLLNQIAYWPVLQETISAGGYWRDTYSSSTF
jgi:hypothetical protein